MEARALNYIAKATGLLLLFRVSPSLCFVARQSTKAIASLGCCIGISPCEQEFGISKLPAIC
eukprot:5492254-Amphidinium_carterae.1